MRRMNDIPTVDKNGKLFSNEAEESPATIGLCWKRCGSHDTAEASTMIQTLCEQSQQVGLYLNRWNKKEVLKENSKSDKVKQSKDSVKQKKIFNILGRLFNYEDLHRIFEIMEDLHRIFEIMEDLFGRHSIVVSCSCSGCIEVWLWQRGLIW